VLDFKGKIIKVKALLSDLLKVSIKLHYLLIWLLFIELIVNIYLSKSYSTTLGLILVIFNTNWLMNGRCHRMHLPNEQAIMTG
jgi:hypothetical protein